MKYLDKLLSEKRYDLYYYTKLLYDGDIPEFIEKYLDLPMFQALKGKGQFCGVDYSKIYNPRCNYTRLDHSINCAGIIWQLTKDKRKTICALCHDLGTPCFAHTIDFLLKDYLNQNSAEKDIKNYLKASKEFLSYLKLDNIALEEVNNPSNYSLVDIERPGVCVDRLEGIIHTAYIWINNYGLEKVRQVINDLTIGTNADAKEEIGFKSLDIAKLFFEMMVSYAYALQSWEDRYSMQFIADLLDVAINDGKIKLEDLYTMNEIDVVRLLSEYQVWQNFLETEKIETTDILPETYYVSVEAKKRYAIPLVATNTGFKRLTDIDSESKIKLEEFFSSKLPRYAYSRKIRKIGN